MGEQKRATQSNSGVNGFTLSNQVVNSIAESLVGIGGHLECMECGHSQPLNESAMAERITHGWPKHCGYTMRWITARQEQGSDLRLDDPEAKVRA